MGVLYREMAKQAVTARQADYLASPTPLGDFTSAHDQKCLARVV